MRSFVCCAVALLPLLVVALDDDSSFVVGNGLSDIQQSSASSQGDYLTPDAMPIFVRQLLEPNALNDTLPLEDARYRIVGGTEMQSIPVWMASVRRPSQLDPLDLEHFCGGTLIDAEWVLTAAHCVKPSLATTYQVWLPSMDPEQPDSFEKYDVDDYRVHPNWNTVTAFNDIALLKLSRSAIETTGDSCGARQPMVLRTDVDIPDGTDLEIIGWGLLEETDTSMPDTIHTATVPAVAEADCVAKYQNSVSDSQFCAGYQNGNVDACAGDSGGPIFISRGDYDEQYGIISWGIGCARAGRYGVYTRVASFVPWLDEIGINLASPTQPLPDSKATKTEGLKEVLVGGPLAIKTKVMPSVYIAFKCSFQCPVYTAPAVFASLDQPIACGSAGNSVGPTSLRANLTIGAAELGQNLTAEVDLLHDEGVVCRPAREFCDEVELKIGEENYCNWTPPGSALEPTVCRIHGPTVFAELRGNPVTEPTVSLTVVADGNRTLDLRTGQDTTPSVLWGLWESNRPVKRTVVSVPAGASQVPSSTVTTYTRSTIDVTDVDMTSGQLLGTFEDVAEDETVSAGDLFCVHSGAAGTNLTTFDCTLTWNSANDAQPVVLQTVESGPTSVEVSAEVRSAGDGSGSGVRSEKVMLAIFAEPPAQATMTVSRNFRERDSAESLQIVMSSAMYLPAQR